MTSTVIGATLELLDVMLRDHGVTFFMLRSR
jgi:hypothetical protein